MGLFGKSKKELLEWQKIISPGTNKLVFTENQLKQHSVSRFNQSMKIIQESIKLCNETKKPDVFFKRWDLIMHHMKILSNLEKYIKFSGDSPSKTLLEFESKKYDAIDDMIDRAWKEYSIKIDSLKTDTARHKNIESFKYDFDQYSCFMSQENISKYILLYNNFLEKYKWNI